MITPAAHGSWSVRPAHRADIDACVALVVAYEGGDPAQWRERFAHRLLDPGGAVYVAMLGDAVVGYGRVSYLATETVEADPPLPVGYYLSGIVVAQMCRRRGIGSALCSVRIAWVADRSPDAWFFTNTGNEASRSLHKRAGFVEVGQFDAPSLDGGRGVLGRRVARATTVA